MPSFTLPGCVRGDGAGLLQLLPYWTRPTPSFAPPGGIPFWRRSTPSFALPGPEATVERGAALKGDAVDYGFICCRWRSSFWRNYARIPHRKFRNHRQAQRFSNPHRWSELFLSTDAGRPLLPHAAMHHNWDGRWGRPSGRFQGRAWSPCLVEAHQLGVPPSQGEPLCSHLEGVATLKITPW